MPASTRHVDIAIIGAGFAGLGMAMALSRAGYEDYVVLEQADELGGTWRDNHYPGCACDVPTPFYSYSFAQKPDWSRLYAPAHEIRDYLQACAEEHGVIERLAFGNELTAATWDTDEQRWHLEVAGEPAGSARVLVLAPGGLSRPSLPDLPGLADFHGSTLHTAQWDHSVELSGARVAVIGTGASAIQVVPEIARTAAQVDVFQRTAPWVLPKPDRRMLRVEKAVFRRIPAVQNALRGLIWGAQEVMGLGNTTDQRITRPLEDVARLHIRRGIADPELRRRVLPDYALGCKRVLLSNSWYPTLAAEHVDLVTEPIQRVGPTGIRTGDDALHLADVIVFATGFRTAEPIGELELRGRDGLTLGDVWRGGVEAHRGTTIAGFPNFFLMPGPNTGTGHTSQVFMIEAQIQHVLAALSRMAQRRATAIEPRAEAQAAFNRDLQRRMGRTVWLRGGCTSWYLDAAGRNTTLWPASSVEFRRSVSRIDDAEFHFEQSRMPVRTSTSNSEVLR